MKPNVPPELSFLERRREVSSTWHLGQAREWLKFDAGRELDCTLVYAAFEFRCAIERYLFELLAVAKGGKLSEDELKECKSRGGVKKLFKKLVPDYGKNVEFTNILGPLSNPSFRIIKVDAPLLLRRWADLSVYCHRLLKPDDSWKANNRTFVAAGFELLRDIDFLFQSWKGKGFVGVTPKESLEPEAREIYEKFVAGELDASQTETRLRLAMPVFQRRMRQRE